MKRWRRKRRAAGHEAQPQILAELRPLVGLDEQLPLIHLCPGEAMPSDIFILKKRRNRRRQALNSLLRGQQFKEPLVLVTGELRSSSGFLLRDAMSAMQLVARNKPIGQQQQHTHNKFFKKPLSEGQLIRFDFATAATSFGGQVGFNASC